MTEKSKAFNDACAAWVDEAMKPRKPFVGRLPDHRPPEPATHFDPRMHLTISDMHQFWKAKPKPAPSFWRRLFGWLPKF